MSETKSKRYGKKGKRTTNSVEQKILFYDTVMDVIKVAISPVLTAIAIIISVITVSGSVLDLKKTEIFSGYLEWFIDSIIWPIVLALILLVIYTGLAVRKYSLNKKNMLKK